MIKMWLEKLTLPNLRSAFLNLGFLLLFLSAWVSDEWPYASYVSMGLALILIIAQVSAIYFAARAYKGDMDAHNFGTTPNVDEPVFESPRPDHKKIAASAYDPFMYETVLPNSGNLILPHVYSTRALATSILAGAVSRKMSDRLLASIFEEQKRRSALIAANWQIDPHGTDAFVINAGALEIEYFHGRTNIRVLDSSRVTVESDMRGKRYDGQASNIDVTTWN